MGSSLTKHRTSWTGDSPVEEISIMQSQNRGPGDIESSKSFGPGNKATMGTMGFDLLSLATSTQGNRKISTCSNRSFKEIGQHPARAISGVSQESDGVDFVKEEKPKKRADKFHSGPARQISDRDASDEGPNRQISGGSSEGSKVAPLSSDAVIGKTLQQSDNEVSLFHLPQYEKDDDISESSGSSDYSEDEEDEEGKSRRQTRRFSDLEKELRMRNMTSKTGEIEDVLAEIMETKVSIIKKIVVHKHFDSFAAFALSSNALFIGYQVNVNAHALSSNPHGACQRLKRWSMSGLHKEDPMRCISMLI